MRRVAAGLVMGTILAAATAPQARAGSITLTAIGPVSVPAGTNIVVDVDLQAADVFDYTNIMIGSPASVNALTFDTDLEWETAFPDTSSDLTFDEPALAPYARNVFLTGDIVGIGTVGPNLDLGDLTIVTAGMAPGVYTLAVSMGDSFTQNVMSEGVEDPLSSPVLEFTIVPEPASAVLLLGAFLLACRRR